MRCKCTLSSKRTYENHDGSPGSTELAFNAVYSPDKASEDHSFWEATPCLTLNITVTRPGAAADLRLGQSFYLDLTPVPSE